MNNIEAPMLKRVWQGLEYRIRACRGTREIYIKAAPTCFGVTVTSSSGSALIRAY